MAPNASARFMGRAITFIAVVIGWVLFRSDTFASAGAMLCAMTGANGLGLGDPLQGWWLLAPLLMLAWVAPNTQEIIGYTTPRQKRPDWDGSHWPKWQPTLGWAAACGLLIAISLLSLSKISEFLYFQF